MSRPASSLSMFMGLVIVLSVAALLAALVVWVWSLVL